jgi:hypothetical protein
MEIEDYKKQLSELRNIIIDGIVYFSVWYVMSNLDADMARGLNRYRGFFLSARKSLNDMALLQFAKVFDNNPRTVSLRNLLLVARTNPTVLVPYAKEDDLDKLESKIDSNEELLGRLKNYRDQRLAHHDRKVTRDTSLKYGQMRQLIDDVKDMYNSLSQGHEQLITSFDFITREAQEHTSKAMGRGRGGRGGNHVRR